LVSAYAVEGSEAAFRALVARHVQLVFAAALRQVGDPGLAEEITQNVFVSLARKAPRLCGVETLAGWLYRTAILEAKSRIRQELRRARREQAAAALSSLQREGSSPLDAVVPLLDEALLNLRETDRLALLLRFFQDQSLSEVGEALGVAEDTARKRVDRALERITKFFRRRGFAVPAGAGCAALLAQVAAAPATAASPALATAAASAGLAAAVPVTGSSFLLPLMSLSKTQTAALCLVLAAVPLAVQWHLGMQAHWATRDASARLRAAHRTETVLDAELEVARAALASMKTERLEAEARRARADAATNSPPPARYAWDDSSTLVRVPKDLLRRVRLQSLGTVHGELSPEIKETLQMREAEGQRVEAATRELIASFRLVEAAHLRQVEPRPAEIGPRAPEEVRAIEVPDLSDEFQRLLATARTIWSETLGPARLELFEKGLAGWVPLDRDATGVSSSQAVFPNEKRLLFYRPGSGARELTWNVSLSFPSGGHASMGAAYPPQEPYRRLVADWLELDPPGATAPGTGGTLR
jgi:RNA polymerase sigma factor (sigma-70 family)